MFIVTNQCSVLPHLSIIERFLKDSCEVHKGPKSGKSPRTDKDTEIFENLMRSDHRLKNGMMTEALNVTKESVR